MGIDTDKEVFKKQEDRDLVLAMLRFEDQMYLSRDGQDIVKTINGIEAGQIIQRLTLEHFGFSPNDESLANYRSILQYYYRSPTDYDEEVLAAVYYLRENHCLYYQTTPLKVGDHVPDVELYELDGKTTCSLSHVLQEDTIRNTILAGFSMS